MYHELTLDDFSFFGGNHINFVDAPRRAEAGLSGAARAVVLDAAEPAEPRPALRDHGPGRRHLQHDQVQLQDPLPAPFGLGQNMFGHKTSRP